VRFLKKRGWWLLVLLLVTMGIILLIRQERNRVPDFSIRHPGKVYKIVMAGPSRTLILVRKGKKWTFADGNPVRTEMAETFLKVLHRIKIKFPVTTKDLEQARSDTTVEKVKVNLKGRFFPIKKLTVYKVTGNIYGNLMTKRGMEPAYICYLPGHTGNLGSWFITRRNFWEPHLLFSYNPTEIKMTELSNISHPEKSFRLEKTGRNQFILTNPATGDTLKNYVIEKATRYFSYFHRIPFDRYETGLTRTAIDSIQRVTPLFILKVSALNRPERVVSILLLEQPDGSPDPDRALALISKDTTPVAIRYFDLDPVLKEIGYFTEN